MQSAPNGARYRRCVIGQLLDEPSDMLGTCGRQDPELRHMPAKRIDQSDPLTRWELVGRCVTQAACCSTVLTGVCCTLGRVTASQIAAASTKSFFCRTT